LLYVWVKLYFIAFVGHRLYLNWWLLKEPLYVVMLKVSSLRL